MRPSREQLLLLVKENSSRVEACLERIQRSVPSNISAVPLNNLNAIVVTCPDASGAERVRELIRAACEDVESITADFEGRPIISSPRRK